MKTASHVASLALLLSLVPAVVLAASSPFNPDLRALPGRTVQARTFNFSALPRAPKPVIPTANEWVGFKIEGIGPSEALVEQLKRRPVAPPLSGFSKITVDPTPAGSQELSPLAPTVGNGFEGIHQSGYIPGEPTVAAGPLNLFTTGNINVVVADKDGSNYHEVTGQTFFNIGSGDGPISDAQCYYDALHGRFVALAFTTGTGASVTLSHFYLAVSQTNDARGAWYVYMFDMALDGTTPTTNWSDYEGLGVSEDKIAMSAQQFSMASNQYKYQKMRVISRAAAFSGGPVPYVDFVNFAPPSGGDVNDNFVTKPARNLTAGDSTIHCICVRTGGGSRVTYRSITGPPSAPVLSSGNLVSVSSYSPPPDAVQKNGGSNKVATNDCRPTDFVVRNGVLTMAWHTSANFGSGIVSALRLFRLRTSDRAVLTDELYGQDGVYYYYPAVTVDSLGTMFLGFGRSSSTEFASVWATGKRRGDASLQASTLVKTGASSTSQSRWGDYTGIDNDAALSGPSGSVAWYSGLWAKATNAFGTWVGRLTFTYGVVAGTVTEDCDGSVVTTSDRSPIAGVSVALKQGVTTLATTTSDASGNYSFGYLETGTYDVVVTPPAGGGSVDAIAGSGGNSQTRVSAIDVQVNLTNAQTSTANQFLVTATHPAPLAANLTPTSKIAGDAAFTLTVNGSAFAPCAVVRWDGSDRATTWVSANQLTASIPASDIAAAGSHLVRVFNPAPGGGLTDTLGFVVNPVATFALTLTSTGRGVVTRAPDQPSYANGTVVTLGATPDSGWAFTGWSGDTATTTASIQVAMGTNRSFTAAFADTAPPAVKVLTPNGGETVLFGQHLNLTWIAIDNAVVARVDLLLSRNGAGGPFDSLAADVPNTGSYDWVVTGPQTTDALFQVVAHDSATGVASDTSDAAFSIPGEAGVRPMAAVTAIELSPVSPNPVHHSGFVSFALPARAHVRLSVHDVQGREVQLLAEGEQEAGRHRVAWGDAASLQTGLYFVRLRVGGQTFMRRAVLIR